MTDPLCRVGHGCLNTAGAPCPPVPSVLRSKMQNAIRHLAEDAPFTRVMGTYAREEPFAPMGVSGSMQAAATASK
eukprot:SAG22_NODE_2254_length_2781_cov_2.255034_3_plen_75_part_00